MGSKDKFFGVAAGAHGVDDIGIAGPSGAISGATNGIYSGPLFANKLRVNVDTNAVIKKGQAIRLASLGTGHVGLTRVLGTVGASGVVVNLPFDGTVVDGTGTWHVDGGSGAWDGFMPMGAALAGASSIEMTFWDPLRQGGNSTASQYLEGEIYMFPGVIRTIRIASAGNIRLFRAASLSPFGKTS